MAIRQLKKAKDQLSKSLKRRKDLVVQMDENLYTERSIEGLCPKRNSNEADAVIKHLSEKNSSLQEEVRKLKREQEI